MWRHIQAILWLRWRLSVNQFTRATSAGKILLAILLVGAVITSVTMFFVASLLGVALLPKSDATLILFL